MTRAPVSVLVVDDDDRYRGAISEILSADNRTQLAGAAADAPSAINQARALRPDVALLDVMIPSGGGEEAARGIREGSPNTRIVALSGHDDRKTITSMLRAGAAGYILKGASPDEILGAVTNAAKGESILSRKVVGEVIESLIEFLECSEGLNKELERINQVKTELIQILAHELLTPVTVIRNSAAFLVTRHATASREQLDDLAGAIESSTGRITRLSNMVITVANLDLGVIKPEISAARIEELLDAASSRLHRDRLIFPKDPNALNRQVWADRELFAKAMSAVLENALELSPEDEPVEIDVAFRNGTAVLSISDRGPGISEELHEAIFEPFFQEDTSTTRVHQGLGMGLYFARRVLSEQGAEIRVESRPGGGSIFLITIPAV